LLDVTGNDTVADPFEDDTWRVTLGGIVPVQRFGYGLTVPENHHRECSALSVSVRVTDKS
jgi:hypothetical protein